MMELEQLKLLLEAVGDLSGNALTVALWWLAAEYGVSLLLGTGTLAAIVFIARMVFRSVMSNNRNYDVLRRVAAKLDCPFSYYPDASDERAINSAIDKLIKTAEALKTENTKLRQDFASERQKMVTENLDLRHRLDSLRRDTPVEE